MTDSGLNTIEVVNPEFHGPMPENPEEKRQRTPALTSAELRKLNFNLRAEIKSLGKTIAEQEKTLRRVSGSGYIPEIKIKEWREKAFLISCKLDDLRDAMREMLLDVNSHPKKQKLKNPDRG